MTVCGFVIGGGVGWAWADAETYDEGGAPTGRDVQKLGVADGALVIVGAGHASTVVEIVTTADSLKGASATAAAAMLGDWARELSARKRAAYERRGETYRPETRFGAILVEDGRLRGLVMKEAEDFRSVPAEAWGSPRLNLWPQKAEDVEAVALAQIGVIKQALPRATGRALTIAKIGPRGVATAAIRLGA